MFTTQPTYQHHPPPARPPAPPGETLKRSIDLLIGMIVIIFNAIQVILIWRIKRKKTIYETFLLSLSVADFLFGLSNVVVCSVYLSKMHFKFGITDFAYTAFLFCIMTSIFHILWIALSRMWAVVYPIQHSVIVTRRKVHILISLTWIMTLLLSLAVLVFQRVKFEASKQAVLNTTVHTASNISNTTARILNKHPPRNILEDNVKMAISITILCADVVYVASYAYIIYSLRKKQPNSKR